MKVTKIDHLGVAVRDADVAAQIYQTLGLPLTETVEVPEQKVKVAFIPIGESTIELVQPTSEESPVAKHLAKRGEGLHHLAVQVDDIDAALSELRAAGIQLIDETPRRGAKGRVAFLHPKSTGRVLIELVEPEQE